MNNPILSVADNIAKKKEKAVVENRRVFGSDNDETNQLLNCYIALKGGEFLDEEKAWGLRINRLSEKIGRLRHAEYDLPGITTAPLLIVCWQPKKSPERCIYSLYEYAPREVQEDWEFLLHLTPDQLIKFDYNKARSKIENQIPGQITFVQMGWAY